MLFIIISLDSIYHRYTSNSYGNPSPIFLQLYAITNSHVRVASLTLNTSRYELSDVLIMTT